MKRNLIKFLIAFTFFLPFTILAQTANTYTIDPSHSYVLWHINHFGFSNPVGKWYANGTLTFDQAKPQNSKLNVTINVANIDTGNPELDKHLLSPQFFDATQFPTATFVSDKVTMVGKNMAKVQGTLTLHGVSKPETLNVKLNKVGINPITNNQTAGFSATTNLKRSDFGMSTLLPGLSDEIKLDIEAEAYIPNTAKS